jgi:hypothetical protein
MIKQFAKLLFPVMVDYRKKGRGMLQIRIFLSAVKKIY